MKIVLDTDIGGDFDDINALLLLCASPEVELVAVTTVGAGASAAKRAQVARTLLISAGHSDVRVYAGFDQPRVPNAVLASLSPEHCLNAWTPEMGDVAVEPSHAVDALIRLANAYGETSTLVCIGAMTNVAAAIVRDPQAMRRFSGIVAMSGAFRSQMREANVFIDPEAADIVYRSGIPLRVIGYEEASKPKLPLSEYREIGKNGSATLALLSTMAQQYSRAYRTPEVTLYDVSAVAAILQPKFFSFRDQTVAVELDGGSSRGLTMVETDPLFNSVPRGTTVSVADESKPDEITALFRSRVLRGQLP